MSLFQDKYRVESTRLKDYDYSSDGAYFVTICTKDREYYFGNVVDDQMRLSKIGQVAYKYWLEIPNHFTNAKLDIFQTMPNHLHLILIIINNDNLCRDEALPRLYGDNNNIFKTKQFYSKISPKPKSLPIIIGSFKSICTKTINKKFPNINFQWQSRFYDHIIRNQKSLDRIRFYIQNNPQNWERDRNNLENLYM